MRATICVAVDQPGEVAAAEAWLERWRGRLAHLSEDYGCGCCVRLYDVDGPPEAIAALPASIRAESDWVSGHSDRPA